jgi:hypothetical protein
MNGLWNNITKKKQKPSQVKSALYQGAACWDANGRMIKSISQFILAASLEISQLHPLPVARRYYHLSQGYNNSIDKTIS